MLRTKEQIIAALKSDGDEDIQSAAALSYDACVYAIGGNRERSAEHLAEAAHRGRRCAAREATAGYLREADERGIMTTARTVEHETPRGTRFVVAWRIGDHMDVIVERVANDGRARAAETLGGVPSAALQARLDGAEKANAELRAYAERQTDAAVRWRDALVQVGTMLGAPMDQTGAADVPRVVAEHMAHPMVHVVPLPHEVREGAIVVKRGETLVLSLPDAAWPDEVDRLGERLRGLPMDVVVLPRDAYAHTVAGTADDVRRRGPCDDCHKPHPGGILFAAEDGYYCGLCPESRRRWDGLVA